MVSVEVFALVVTILVWLLVGAIALVVHLYRLLEETSDAISAVAGDLDQVERDMWPHDAESLWWRRWVSSCRWDLIRLVQDMNPILRAMDLGHQWVMMRWWVYDRLHRPLEVRFNDGE